MFDIVIPVGPNEIDNIHSQLMMTRANVIGFRNIYIICYDSNVKIDGCIMIHENMFPFKIDDVAEIFARYHGKKNRNNWYFQQLLKLYIGFIVPDILDKYLVIDSDVFFLKPIEFIKDNKMIFTTGNENHPPYFKHMSKVHPSFTKNINKSGIAHHMIFYKKYIQEIFDIVEEYHKIPFWKVFLEMVEEHKKYEIENIESGASEYELYFNYVYKYHNDNIIIRTLSWENKPVFYKFENDYDYDFVAICSWKTWL